MPSILPLLEQKQKQLNGDLQVGMVKMFQLLYNYYYSDTSKSNRILEWDLYINPFKNSLTILTAEYDALISAISEEIEG